MRSLKRAALALASGSSLIACAGSALAMEASVVSGLYRNQSYKSDGNDAGSKTIINAGARLAGPLGGPLFWFGQGELGLRSYTKGDNTDAPSSSTSLSLGGGVRYYFLKLSDRIEPYAALRGAYREAKDATLRAGGYTETDNNGLYYGSDFGIRLSLQKEFFVDFELSLFDSALFATEKSTDTTLGNPKVVKSTETKRTELFAQSTGNFNDFKVALGMRF